MVPAILATLAVGAALYHWSPTRQRQRILAQPFPEEWEGYLQRNCPIYRGLPEELRLELRQRVKVFLAEKQFIGCGGLAVTDEMRVTVAGLACLLLLNRETSTYPGLSEILLYPGAYVIEDRSQVRLGESWTHGTVVLSWNDVLRSAHDYRDGHNLALHEFAHQLDQQDGESDGIPPLPCGARYSAFARVLHREFDRLVDSTQHHRKTLLDAYGATNPAEFFAVATETFFEKPHQLQKKHPALYEQLCLFYNQDPGAWKIPPAN